MEITDKTQSRPRLMNSSHAYVWEVTTTEWSDRIDDFVDILQAVFYDPWKAVQWATEHYGVGCMVQLSVRQI